MEIPVMESAHQDYADQGFHMIVLLGEGLFGEDATIEDLNAWPMEHGGASFKVLADPAWGYATKLWGGKQVGRAILVAPGVEVVVVTEIGVEEAFEKIPDYLP